MPRLDTHPCSVENAHPPWRDEGLGAFLVLGGVIVYHPANHFLVRSAMLRRLLSGGRKKQHSFRISSSMIGSAKIGRKKKEMRKVSEVKVLQKYRLELVFDDGVRGVVDLSDSVGKGVFAIWRDPHIFEQVRIGSFGELTWGDQIDLCPDSLYLKATGKKPEEVFPALRCESTYA